jgi:hypothetical protein
VTDFNIKVSADTQQAEQKLQAVDTAANAVAKPRNISLQFPDYADISRNVNTLSKDVQNAANSVKEFYRIGSSIPFTPLNDFKELTEQTKTMVGSTVKMADQFGTAGKVISSSMGTARGAVDGVIVSLAKLGFALAGIQASVGILRQGFGGLFQETIGREAQLRATILKTQTTLASTNKVFRNGSEITDPYQKIVTLTGAVAKNITSIRERSIALAGVTSNEVIEVFGIVASQIGQIGGGLKEAEDLAINFAAALGTFGIPLYQARQEVGSILRGDITVDSYLARALGITNEDVAKAKTQAGGVVEFLEKRLASSVAGQRIAAQGLSGVLSNLKDISELVSQSFGAGLLDPLLSGLNAAFAALEEIRKSLMAVAKTAGTSLGGVLSLNAGRISEGSALTPKDASGANAALTQLNASLAAAGTKLNAVFDTVYKQITSIVDRLGPALAVVVDGFTKLAAGLVSLQIEKFKALVGVFSAIVPLIQGASAALNGFLSVWGGILQLPIVQQFSQITAGMALLNATGVTRLVRSGLLLKVVFEQWGKISEFVRTQFQLLRTMIGGLVVNIGQFITTMAAAAKAAATAWAPTNVALKALREEIILVTGQFVTMGQAAQDAGNKVGGLGRSATGAKSQIIGMALNFLKANLIVLAITASISLLTERLGAYQEQQNKIASDNRARQALLDLKTKYKDLGDAASESEKRAAAFAQSLVDDKYDQAVQNLEKIRKKLVELRDLANSENDFRKLAQFFNPANFDVFSKKFTDAFKSGKPINLFADFDKDVLAARLNDERAAAEELATWELELDKQNLDNNIRLEAEKRTNLEKELAEFRRQTDNELFQQRQVLASKEIEVFRAANDLQIAQLEIGLAKMRDAQQGNADQAIADLDAYIVRKKSGENEIEAQRRALQVELTKLERDIMDYRYAKEKEMAKLRQKIGEYDMAVADYKVKMAEQEGKARIEGAAASMAGAGPGRTGNTGLFQGNTGTNSSGDHFHVEGAATEAAARAIFANAGALKLTDVPGSPRDGGAREHAGFDLAGPKGTPLNLAPGYTLLDFTASPNSKGGNFVTVRGPDGKQYIIRHIAQPAPNWSMAGGTQATAAGAAGGITGRAGQVLNQLTNRGLTNPYGLAAVLGTAQQESRFSPYVEAGGSQGLMQWKGSRRANMPTPDRGRRYPDRDLAAQVDFFLREASGADPASSGVLNKLKSAKNLDEAMAAMKQFTRYSKAGDRKKFAEQYLAQLGGTGGGATAAGARPDIPKPLAPTFDQDAASIDQFTKTNRTIQEMEKNLQSFRESLATAQNDEAFRNILKNLFPQVDLVAARNELSGLETSLTSLRDVVIDVYDPDKLSLATQQANELNLVESKRKDYMEALDKRLKEGIVDKETYNKLVEKLNEDEAKHLTDLEAQYKLREKILALTKSEASVRALLNDAFRIQLDSENELFQLRESFLDAQAQAGGRDNPLLARRRGAESLIRARAFADSNGGRNPLDADQTAALEKFAAQARSSAEALGQLELALFNYNKQLAFAKDIAGAFSGGLKTIFSSAIRGGDLNEAVSSFLDGLTDKLLTMATDYAFKPVEMQLEQVFKDLFGVKDPLIDAQALQTTATETNTAAINNLTNALTTTAAAAPTGAGGATALPVIPFGGVDAANDISSFSRSGGGLPSAVQDLTASVTSTTSTLDATAAAAANAPSAFGGLQNTLGNLVGALSSLALIFSGASQIGQKGGFLKGLAGIFTGLGSLGLGGFGGLFPGRASGGSVIKDKPYIVGENRPELFVPDQSGFIIPEVPAGLTDAATGQEGALDAASPTGRARTALQRQLAQLTPGDSATGPSAGGATAIARRYLAEQLRNAEDRERAQQETAALLEAGRQQSLKLGTFSLGSLDVATKADALAFARQAEKAAEARVFSKIKNQRSIPGIR